MRWGSRLQLGVFVRLHIRRSLRGCTKLPVFLIQSSGSWVLFSSVLHLLSSVWFLFIFFFPCHCSLLFTTAELTLSLPVVTWADSVKLLSGPLAVLFICVCLALVVTGFFFFSLPYLSKPRVEHKAPGPDSVRRVILSGLWDYHVFFFFLTMLPSLNGYIFYVRLLQGSVRSFLTSFTSIPRRPLQYVVRSHFVQ